MTKEEIKNIAELIKTTEGIKASGDAFIHNLERDLKVRFPGIDADRLSIMCQKVASIIREEFGYIEIGVIKLLESIQKIDASRSDNDQVSERTMQRRAKAEREARENKNSNN